ncbi:MAG TPA: T9SS type A sorting domain-containing protein [Bacteroidia bacterium]|nr:T9SS type A sorting domain-containing protein [Bacteroidia bacterium]
MKKIYLILFLISGFANMQSTIAQTAPQWIRNLNTLPDTAFLFPVKTMVDLNNNIFVLSTYHKYIQPSDFINKISLNKYDPSGNLIWNLDFDNGGIGKPRAFDMELDSSGNCYLAGALMESPNYKPLLMKVSGSGLILWVRDSCTAFNTSQYKQIIYKNDLIYLSNEAGIAVFDMNGNEQWSDAMAPIRIAVDNAGRMLVSTYGISSQTLFRYNLNGSLDFSDSTIVADRIAVDSYNNIYLLAQWPNYNIAKLDSNGTFIWWQDDYPLNLSFGDPGFDLLVDFYNDIYLIGLSDSMYKLRPDGSLIWQHSMNGLDNYIIDAKITYSNYLMICGTVADTVAGGTTIKMYNLNGTVNWGAYYRSNLQQDFPVSMAITLSGIYVLADSVSNSSLLKFEGPFNNPNIDFNQFCVDSVWYDPSDHQFVFVRVVNGSLGGLNYPSVQIVSPGGDTISNPSNQVNFFVHIANIPLVYRDSILVQGINDFSNYTFLISAGFGDTTAAIGWCGTLSVDESMFNHMSLYPNPVEETLNIVLNRASQTYTIEIISSKGQILKRFQVGSERTIRLPVSSLPAGLYFVKLSDRSSQFYSRFIKH